MADSLEHDAAIALLRTILAALDASGHRYALIHAGPSLNTVSSDVDIALDGPPNEIIVPILKRVERETGARLVQCLHYEVPYGYYYIVEVPVRPVTFLHLDCLYDPYGVNRYRLPTSVLLDRAVAGAWGMQTARDTTALHLLLKRAVKGSVSREAIEELRQHIDLTSGALSAGVRRWLGSRATLLVGRLLESDANCRSTDVLRQLRRSADWTFRLRHPWRSMIGLAWNAVRAMRRVVQPTGLFVVLIGPDGAGKSTIAGLVERRLARAFRRTWRFHWRPGILPKLRPSRQGSDARSASEAPPTTSKYGTSMSLVRFVYYWLDFIAGYATAIYARKARTTLVIGERYFIDVLVHPQRYGFALPRWMIRLASACVPAPDFVVLLKADAQTIFARKPELSPAAISAQSHDYENEMKHWGRTIVIESSGDADAVADEVCDAIVGECTARTARRLRANREPQWRAFPSAANPKLWIADEEAPSHALDLYHPYSACGRLATAAIRTLPARLHRALFAQRPDIQTGKRLEEVACLIRSILGDEGIAVSYCDNSPAHSRLTAQASRDGRVLAYVKCRLVGADAGAIAHEAAFLAWLLDVGLSTALVPAVLKTATSDGHELLILTAPATAGTRRPLEADGRDAAFLSELGTKEQAPLTVSEFLGSEDLQALVADVSLGRATAAMLREVIESVSATFDASGIRTAPCHGDYAPWNTLALANGALYVFDWEHAKTRGPLLTDAFHRILMPARLVQRKQPRRVIAQLRRLHDDPALGDVVARLRVSQEELPAYLLLYLLGLAARERIADGAPSAFVLECLRYALGALPHPARRRNVLVAAYACEPERGSEPGVGWHMCQAISRENNAWVITRTNNREKIERALAGAPNPHLNFCYADLPPWARFWKRGARGIRVYYYLWQFAAWREARRLMRTVPFDLAHHVTFVNGSVFSFLGLVGLPFVWGPIGANRLLPATLQCSWKAVAVDRVRHAILRLSRTADPLYWGCAYRAALVIGIHPRIGRLFPLSLLAKERFVSHAAIGVEADVLSRSRNPPSASEIVVLTMGQLVAIKAFHLAILAFGRLLAREPNARLVVVGDGPERKRLQRLSESLDIADHVVFDGWLPRAKALARMREAHVFLFPSFEGAGMVVLEAMAHGLPVVCLDFGGPGEMVGDDCGFAVATGTLDETVGRLVDSLLILARDEALRDRMGAAARNRVTRDYLWNERHRTIRQWYSMATSRRSKGKRPAQVTTPLESP